MFRAHPLQPPTPERHAACVCESMMRERSFLLAPFSPHAASTPWQALPSTCHCRARPLLLHFRLPRPSALSALPHSLLSTHRNALLASA